MRTYERTKRGFNYTITKKGKEKMTPRTYNIPGHLEWYMNYYSTEKGVDVADIVRESIIQFFQKNDQKIIEELGYVDYELDTYTSYEYRELYGKYSGKNLP